MKNVQGIIGIVIIFALLFFAWRFVLRFRAGENEALPETDFGDMLLGGLFNPNVDFSDLVAQAASVPAVIPTDPVKNLGGQKSCCNVCEGEQQAARRSVGAGDVQITWTAPVVKVPEIIQFIAPPTPLIDPTVGKRVDADSCAWNAEGYLSRNPDVAREYSRNLSFFRTRDRGKREDAEAERRKQQTLWGVDIKTRAGFAEAHWNNSGKREGRSWDCPGAEEPAKRIDRSWQTPSWMPQGFPRLRGTA